MMIGVSTHSRPKAAGPKYSPGTVNTSFQHTAARRRLVKPLPLPIPQQKVSTHSRPKAAGAMATSANIVTHVSTHSRPKAAGPKFEALHRVFDVSTHSRPKAAGRQIEDNKLDDPVSTHSRPKAAGEVLAEAAKRLNEFQHTAARRRLVLGLLAKSFDLVFQHTAARRRLGLAVIPNRFKLLVSTHSRPKAAGAFLKSLAPSGFAAPISLSSREKREREYNTAFSVTPAFAIS